MSQKVNLEFVIGDAICSLAATLMSLSRATKELDTNDEADRHRIAQVIRGNEIHLKETIDKLQAALKANGSNLTIKLEGDDE